MDLSTYPTQWIELKRIDENDRKHCLRRKLDTGKIKPSLKERGQDFPVILRCHPELGSGSKLQIICGFTRFTAIKELGWEKILAVVIPVEDLNDEQAMELCLRENIERQSYADLEILDICQSMHNADKNNVQIAKELKITETSVRRYLGIFDLPNHIKNWVLKGELSLGIGYRLVKILAGGRHSVEAVDKLKNAIYCAKSPKEVKELLKSIKKPAKSGKSIVPGSEFIVKEKQPETINNKLETESIEQVEKERDAAKDAYLKEKAEYKESVARETGTESLPFDPKEIAKRITQQFGNLGDLDLSGGPGQGTLDKIKDMMSASGIPVSGVPRDPGSQTPPNFAEIPGSAIRIKRGDQVIEATIPINLDADDEIDKIVIYIK